MRAKQGSLTSKKNEEIISTFYKNLIGEMQEQIAQKDGRLQEARAEVASREGQIAGLLESLRCLK